MSFPAAWLSETETVFRAEDFLCVAPGTPNRIARVQITPPAPCALNGEGAGCAARLRLSAREGRSTVLRGTTGPLLAELPRLHREVPKEEAARSFLRFFAVLHQLEPGAFGEPTQEHRRILRALAKAAEMCRNLNSPKRFQLLGDPAAAPVGLEATWLERKLFFLAGDCPAADFPGGTPEWELLGEGGVTINFSEDCKGLTVYVYDPYGRPRAAWGGKRGCPHRFFLRPGEQITLGEG
jgi:hypothetical protein